MAGSRSRTRPRSASTIGPKGRPPSPMFAQPPVRTRMPRALAMVPSSAMSRDLPTPASPATSRWVAAASPTRSSVRGHDGQLVLAPDQGRADGSSGHGVDHTVGSGGSGGWRGRPFDQAPAPTWATARRRATRRPTARRGERRQGRALRLQVAQDAAQARFGGVADRGGGRPDGGGPGRWCGSACIGGSFGSVGRPSWVGLVVGPQPRRRRRALPSSEHPNLGAGLDLDFASEEPLGRPSATLQPMPGRTGGLRRTGRRAPCRVGRP